MINSYLSKKEKERAELLGDIDEPDIIEKAESKKNRSKNKNKEGDGPDMSGNDKTPGSRKEGEDVKDNGDESDLKKYEKNQD